MWEATTFHVIPFPCLLVCMASYWLSWSSVGLPPFPQTQSLSSLCHCVYDIVNFCSTLLCHVTHYSACMYVMRHAFGYHAYFSWCARRSDATAFLSSVALSIFSVQHLLAVARRFFVSSGVDSGIKKSLSKDLMSWKYVSSRCIPSTSKVILLCCLVLHNGKSPTHHPCFPLLELNCQTADGRACYMLWLSWGWGQCLWLLFLQLSYSFHIFLNCTTFMSDYSPPHHWAVGHVLSTSSFCNPLLVPGVAPLELHLLEHHDKPFTLWDETRWSKCPSTCVTWTLQLGGWHIYIWYSRR